MDATDQPPPVAPAEGAPVDTADPAETERSSRTPPLVATPVGDLLREALDFQPPGLAIEARPLPFPARGVLYVVVGFVVLLITWAALAEVDRIVTAQGRLITTAVSILIQPLERSVIRSIDVTVGQTVKAGEILATLDPTFTAADVANLRTRLNSLSAQEDRLRAEVEGRPYEPLPDSDDGRIQAGIAAQRRAEYAARVVGLDERVARTRAELETNRSARTGLSQRLDVLSSIETMRRELFQNAHGSRLTYLEAQRDRISLETDLDSLRNKSLELQHSLREAEGEQAAFVQEWRRRAAEELITVGRDRRAAAEELTKAERRSFLISMTAPRDSIVLEVANRLSIGSVVREAEPLVTLVPIDVALEVEVEIPARDIGFVQGGDPARVKMEAFPFQRHGTLDGLVRTISADAFQREPQSGGGAYFRARLSLKSTELAAIPAGIRLSPGMVTTAEIQVGRRTVLSYLLYPLFRALDEGIREP